MFKELFKEHLAFTSTAKRFIEAEFSPHLKDWEKLGYFPNEAFEKLGEAGYLGVLISEEYGGIGGDYTMAAAWCDIFGTLCDVGFTTAINMHSLVVSHALEKFGSEYAKKYWLPRAVTGKLIGAYAFTEPNAGSDLRSIRTNAKFNGKKWVLNGSKTFITNGKRADFILVLARTTDSNSNEKSSESFTTFIVDTNCLGFKVTRTLDKLGWNSSDTAELSLENVEVQPEFVLGEVGQGWAQASANLNWERVMLTVLTQAGARTCYEETLEYASQREAFGKLIKDLPAIKQELISMYSMLALNEALLSDTIRALPENNTKSTQLVALSKRQVCDDSVAIANKCIQIHGGYGYTKEFNAERWWRDLRLMQIGGGSSEIMGNIAFKALNSKAVEE
jgi:acyl-CoA dehydrogenase